MKILQINVSLNSGSTGRIAEDIGKKIIANQADSFIGYGRNITTTTSQAIKIGSKTDQAIHLIQSRILDNHGLASSKPTIEFVKKIEEIQPDIIHLHNIHGYYLNYKALFNFLKKYNKPVVWTLHDCWSFTGHCPHFDHVNCNKWETECHSCILKKRYPASYGLDQSKRNFILKKELFNALNDLTIVTVSRWLKNLVDRSFLQKHKNLVIYNGVDLSIFKPSSSEVKTKYGLLQRKFILGVSNVWGGRKGLKDFIELRKILDQDIAIVLVGLTKKQIQKLPANIIGIPRTESIQELADLYAAAEIFVNPSILETFGMVTAEAMSCGTPVVVYNATASPELVNKETGLIVEKENIQGLKKAIITILNKGKEAYSQSCRKVAEDLFDKEKQSQKYIQLYKKILNI